MAKREKSHQWRINKRKMTTSDGRSKNTKPKNKNKKRNYKKYRGQGKA